MRMEWLPLWLRQKGAKNTHLSKDWGWCRGGGGCVRGNKNAKEVWAEPSTKTRRVGGGNDGGCIKDWYCTKKTSDARAPSKNKIIVIKKIKDNIFNQLCTENINRVSKWIISSLHINNSCWKITKMISWGYSICAFKMNSSLGTFNEGEGTKALYSAPPLCFSTKEGFLLGFF